MPTPCNVCRAEPPVNACAAIRVLGRQWTLTHCYVFWAVSERRRTATCFGPSVNADALLCVLGRQWTLTHCYVFWAVSERWRTAMCFGPSVNADALLSVLGYQWKLTHCYVFWATSERLRAAPRSVWRDLSRRAVHTGPRTCRCALRFRLLARVRRHRAGRPAMWLRRPMERSRHAAAVWEWVGNRDLTRSDGIFDRIWWDLTAVEVNLTEFGGIWRDLTALTGFDGIWRDSTRYNGI